MRRLTLALLAVAVLATSCASTRHEAVKHCGDTPKNAVGVFLQGIKEFSLALLEAVTPDGSSLYGIFGNNDKSRGKEVVRQISANPEVVEEGGSCSCSLLSVKNTGDPNEKIVEVKRDIVVGDGLHNYKRAFRVRFEPRGNCIVRIDLIDQKWERIVKK